MKYNQAILRKLDDERWKARFRFKEDGEWKEVTRNIRATSKRTARKVASEIHAELEEAAEREALGPTLILEGDDARIGAFLGRYIESLLGSGSIQRATAAAYRHSRAHICRYLADVRLDELTPEMILDMQDRLLNDDGLVPDTVARDHRLLKQAVNYAVEIGALAKSPFTKSVKAPKRRRRDPNSLDDAGRARLLLALDSMVDTVVTRGVRLALSAGLRREEICGLRWRDVDFDADVIRVRSAVTEVDGEVYEKGPKTETSRQDVILEPDLKLRLMRRREAMESVLPLEDRRALPDRFVIGSARGGPYTPSMLGRGFGTLARSLDLRGTTGKIVCLHDLRHTFATYLVARGVDIKTVASLMGHADAAMTLNIYASADPKARQQAAEVVAEAMAERPEPKLRLCVS